MDNSRLTTLRGNTHPLARPQFDQGAAPPDLPMNRMLLMLQRSPEQEVALQDLLVQQQTTGSANFHKWLTPDEFGRQFGPADADIQAVTSWLASFGFQSIQVSRGRTTIEFSGTASQVAAALHTPIHRYVLNGESHWANANDPQIPAALAPVVSGIVSLHDFRKKPASIRSGRTATLTRTPDGKPQINFTDGSHGIAPADFAQIYNIASTMTGSGVTIGVVARSNINAQDVANFRSIFGLPANNLNIVIDGPDPGNFNPGGGEEAEAVLDATWPGAVAPSATVDLVVSESTNAVSGEDLSEIYIINNNLADIMTESFSVCESQVSSATASFYSGAAEQAAAQGITDLVASGDGGPDSCDNQATIPTTDAPASVNVLASTAFTIAVGGTELHDCDPLPGCVDSAGTYWQSTNGTNHESARRYIPENVWNESCTTLGTNCTAVGLWSSGGGQSMFCSQIPSFCKPFWQAGVSGIPSSGGRAVPDVAVAAADHDGYVLCLDGSCSGSTPGFAILSGTSASVQAFGGIMALVDQSNGRQGQADVVLYKLAAGQPPTAPANNSCDGSNTTTPPASTCIFHDVTSGNTNIPGENGFAATTGYDEATGLGSVNVSNLLAQWNTAIIKASTTTLILNNNTAVNVTHGTSVPVNITVAATPPGTGTPTGDVSLVATNSGTGQGVDGFTLSNGSISASTIFLPGGANYTVKAHYAGDATFLGSDSAPVTVTVNKESTSTLIGMVPVGSTSCAPTTSTTYGSAYLTVGVVDSKGGGAVCLPTETGASPTGTVTVSDTINGTPSGLNGVSFNLNSQGYFEDQTIPPPVGTHTITAAYAGDNSFNSSTSSSLVLTVTQASTTASVSASSTAVATGTPVTLTATVATQSFATANASQEPTGTVQFFVDGSASGSPVAVAGGASSAIPPTALATASIPLTLVNGTHTVTAKYLGDTNYAASAVSAGVTVNVGTPGINISPASNTVTITISAAGQSGTQPITVSAANGFTGSVALTCAVTTAMTGVYGMPTCSFTPSSTITLTSSTTSGQQTLNVNTTAASSVFKPSGRRRGPGASPLTVAEILTALAGMLLLALMVKRRRGVMLLALAIVAVVAIGSSCGNNYSNGGSHPGTTTGTYTVTVTATPPSGGGASAQSTMIAVNVQ